MTALTAPLALVFLAPFVVLALGRRGVFLVVAAALGVLLAGRADGPSLRAALLAAPLAAAALAGARRPRAVVAALFWAGLCTLPRWGPVGPWAWRLWPGAAVAGRDADLALAPALYERWGSVLPTPPPPFPVVLAAWSVLAALALWRRRPVAMLGADGPPAAQP